MNNPTQIIEMYVVVMQGYLKLMTDSEIIQQSKIVNHLTYVGWNTINHIFKLIYNRTHNLQTTYTCVQKACFCYLEYIEQINNLTTTPIDNGLNHKDAVLFVYNRILTEYIENGKKTDKDQANNTTDISNQLTVIEQSSIQEIINITSCISSWNNTKLSTFEQQCICNRFLRQYLNLLIEPLNENEPKINTVIMCKIMETIQNKLIMDYDVYTIFLSEFYKILSSFKINDFTENEIDIFCLDNFCGKKIVDLMNTFSIQMYVENINSIEKKTIYMRKLLKGFFL